MFRKMAALNFPIFYDYTKSYTTTNLAHFSLSVLELFDNSLQKLSVGSVFLRGV